MSGLSLLKVSEVMNPKERAKLVISLELKGLEVAWVEGPIPNYNEIEQVVAACPSSQGREYNFLIELKDYIWKRLLILISLNHDALDIIDNKMVLIRYLLGISPALNASLQMVMRKQSENKSGKVDREEDAVVSFLESILQIRVEDGNVVNLANPRVAEALKIFKQRFGEIVNEVHAYITVIEKIEQKYFDGMEIVSRKTEHPTGFIPRTLAAISQVIESHNGDLKEVTEGFNLMGLGLGEYKFDELNQYLLDADYQVDDVWVVKELAKIEEVVRK